MLEKSNSAENEHEFLEIAQVATTDTASLLEIGGLI